MANSYVKLAAWPTSWRPPGADRFPLREPKVNSRIWLCAVDDGTTNIVLCIIIIIITIIIIIIIIVMFIGIVNVTSLSLSSSSSSLFSSSPLQSRIRYWYILTQVKQQNDHKTNVVVIFQC